MVLIICAYYPDVCFITQDQPLPGVLKDIFGMGDVAKIWIFFILAIFFVNICKIFYCVRTQLFISGS